MMETLPVGTILDVELIAHPEHDDYDYVGSILRSKPKKAVKKQSDTGDFLIPYVFDMLYYWNNDITTKPYLERINLLKKVAHDLPMIMVEPYFMQTIDQVKKMLNEYVAKGGEGLVLWNGSAPTKIRYDGKPDRKGGAYKMKPVYEDDFYVRGHELGNGKNADVVGAVFIFQRDKDGNEISWGKCGGFAGDSSIRKELLKEDLTSGSLVVQVEFSKRNKAGLRFPVVQRIRRDKTAKECIYHG